MNANTWISCSSVLPPNDKIVETKIEDSGGTRNIQKLKRNNNLWFVEDGSIYVYYAPTHWREV